MTVMSADDTPTPRAGGAVCCDVGVSRGSLYPPTFRCDPGSKREKLRRLASEFAAKSGQVLICLPFPCTLKA